MKEFWDDRYAADEFIYGTDPNEWLAHHLENLTPGKALFPAEGEGRNAVYAAKKGWQSEAFDFSKSAAKKAGKLARENGVNLSYSVCGGEDYPWQAGVYDLILLSYVHMEPESRQIFHRKVLEALKPGGTVILEAFSPEQLHYQSGGPKNADWLFSLEDLQKDFAGMQVSEIKQEIIQLNEGTGHHGEGSVVRFLARKP